MTPYVMKFTKQLCIAAVSFLACSVNAQTDSAPLECIAQAEKLTPCEHLIIKKTDPRILRSSSISTPTVCICLSDFPSLFDEQASTPALEHTEEAILDQWALTKRQLNHLLRY